MTHTSALESLLKRDRAIVLAGLIGVQATAKPKPQGRAQSA